MKTIYSIALICILSVLNSNPSFSVTTQEIDQAVQAAKILKFGESSKSHRDIDNYINQTHENQTLRIYLEQQIAKVLGDESTTVAASKFFCRKLGVIGTEESLPYLSYLLQQEDKTEYACFALKNNPSPKVDKILIKSLESLEGYAKVPVINVLGERRANESVDTLIQLTQRNSAEVNRAAVYAIGNIATTQCAEFLSALSATNSNISFELSDAYLQCAIQFITDGRIEDAVSIFNELDNDNHPLVIQRGARYNLLDVGRLDINFDDIKPVTLFDNNSFDGWEGNLEFFRIEDGAIVAGNLNDNIPRNEFLTTKQEYDNFELRLQVKLTSKDANAGIQIRSIRIPNHNEMIGYQADMGQHYWGCLYDESRRRTVLAQPNAEELAKVLNYTGWNDYVIRCTGRRVQLWINGYQTVDYLEPNESLSQSGLIGLQIHSGPPAEASYRNIEIRVFEESNW